MRIDMMDVVMGIGVGGVDEVLAIQDADAGRVESFKTWSDFFRIGAVALGFLGMTVDMFPKFAKPVAQSATPLLTKSVIQAFRSSSMTSQANRTAIADRTSTNIRKSRVGWKPQGIVA